MPEQEFYFVSPQEHHRLTKIESEGQRKLVTEDGIEFGFVDDFPNLVYPSILESKEKNTLEFYENRAAVYDKFLYQTFKTHGENETTTRNGFIDKLKIKSDSKILEVACGTGRDSELIAKRLDSRGKLVLQDISHVYVEYLQTEIGII